MPSAITSHFYPVSDREPMRFGILLSTASAPLIIVPLIHLWVMSDLQVLGVGGMRSRFRWFAFCVDVPHPNKGLAMLSR